MTKHISLTALFRVAMGVILTFAIPLQGQAADELFPITDAPLREWTSRYGTKTVARLSSYITSRPDIPVSTDIRLPGTEVELKKDDGKLVRVPTRELCDEDSKYIVEEMQTLRSKDHERRLQGFLRAPNSRARSYWADPLDGGYAITDAETKSVTYFSVKDGRVTTRNQQPLHPRRSQEEFGTTYEHLLNTIDTLRIAAYEFKLALPSRSLEGKIAGIEGKEIVIPVGSNHCVRPRMRFSVLREGTQLKNPETGKSLGLNVRKIGSLGVTEVQPEFSRAIPIADPDDKPQAFEVGDVIRYDAAHGSVAVLLMADAEDAAPDVPLATKGAASDGRLSIPGKVVSERFTSELVNVDIPVVERTLLTRVLNQLAIQEKKTENPVFDPTIAREFGKQVGASFVVGGTLSEWRKTTDTPGLGRRPPIESNRPVTHSVRAHIRLVDVETGEVIKAVSGRVYADIAQ